MKPHGHADRRQAGEVRADGEDVGQIHLQRIGDALAELERRGRAGRHRDDVDPLERVLVVAADERAHLLRLQIVRVVVAGAEHVGAEHDAALHLGAEALRARPPVHRAQIVLHLPGCRRVAARGIRSARRRSARGSSSLRRWPPGSRPGWRRRRAAASMSTSVAPRRAQHVERRLERRGHFGVDALVDERTRHADPQPAGVAGERRRDSRAPAPARSSRRSGRRRRSRDSAMRGVFDGARERSDLIERRREGEQAVARDAAVGRLEARRCRRAPPAGGSNPPVSEPSASGAIPAATATADPPLDPPGMRSVRPRISRRAERRVLGRRAHRELVAVGLADDDRAGRFEPRRRPSRRTAGRSARGSATTPWCGRRACRGCP